MITSWKVNWTYLIYFARYLSSGKEKDEEEEEEDVQIWSTSFLVWVILLFV